MCPCELQLAPLYMSSVFCTVSFCTVSFLPTVPISEKNRFLSVQFGMCYLWFSDTALLLGDYILLDRETSKYCPGWLLLQLKRNKQKRGRGLFPFFWIVRSQKPLPLAPSLGLRTFKSQSVTGEARLLRLRSSSHEQGCPWRRPGPQRGRTISSRTQTYCSWMTRGCTWSVVSARSRTRRAEARSPSQ